MATPFSLYPVASDVIEHLIALHTQIRDAVRVSLDSRPIDEQLTSEREGDDDVSFPIDVVAEDIITEHMRTVPEPVVVIAEGIGTRVFPEGASEAEARWRLIIDPIDGTRELATGKRSAWVLSGLAPNRGDATTLADIAFAIQTGNSTLPTLSHCLTCSAG